jgi:hypothetical protein
MRKLIFLGAILAFPLLSGCSIVTGDDGRKHVHWHLFEVFVGGVIDSILPGDEKTPTADLLINDECTEDCKRIEDKPLIDEAPYNAYKR